MNYFSKIAFVSLSLFALTAAAELGGKWFGAGSISDTDGFELQCEVMNFDVVHTPQTLNVVPSFTCGGDTFEAPVGEMEIRGQGDLYRNGQRVGHLDADTIQATFVDGGSTMTILVKYTETALNFRAELRQADSPTYLMTIQGDATR